jgi:acyl-CoA reductase-like NAD-dependent aldehyde dehydrogenase
VTAVPERRPFIRGASRATGEIVEIRAPHTGEPVARVHRAGRADVEAAVAAAVEGFEATRRMPAHERARILSAVAEEIARRREEMARVLALEAGKPLKAARTEAERSVHTFQTAAEEAKRLGGEVVPFDVVPWGAGRVGIVRRFPAGPVAGITPFNFPLNLTAHKVAPALASGCSIVVKPASQTPSPAILLAEMAAAAGAPPGAVNVVTASAEAAEPLVLDERIKVLTFTGSPAVGWDLKARAGKKRVTLELGGNAAAVVCAGADLAYAAERVVLGGYGYAGQSCISVQRVLVERKVHDEFLGVLLAKVRTLRTGDPLDETTDVGPMISASEAGRAESWIREAVASGARLLAGGGREGAFLRPTVLADTRPDMKVECMEVFAPVVTVAPFDDLESALKAVNDSRYGLQAGVFTPDAKAAWKAFEALQVGGVIVNDVPTYRVDHMPYGGVKDSGFGREGLRYAIEGMTEPRLLVWNLS